MRAHSVASHRRMLVLGLQDDQIFTPLFEVARELTGGVAILPVMVDGHDFQWVPLPRESVDAFPLNWIAAIRETFADSSTDKLP